jgi:mitogen-activated protein kinase kinase kinase 1
MALQKSSFFLSSIIKANNNTQTQNHAFPVSNGMDSKKHRRKPKHERRDAIKFFNYDAQSLSSSSLSSSSSSSFDSSSSVYTCSMDLCDRTSFRIDDIEGVFDQIYRSLGFSGPEDFAIDTLSLSESPIDEPNSDEESDSPTIGRDKPRSLCG